MKYKHLINLLKVVAVAHDGCSDCLIILAASPLSRLPRRVSTAGQSRAKVSPLIITFATRDRITNITMIGRAKWKINASYSNYRG